jgi:hypothetical protein
VKEAAVAAIKNIYPKWSGFHFKPKFCMHFSSFPCVLYVPPISSSLFSSP